MCSLRYKRTDVIVHHDGFWQVSVSVTTVQIEEEDLPQRSPAPPSLHLPPPRQSLQIQSQGRKPWERRTLHARNHAVSAFSLSGFFPSASRL